jgi:hypothetical protein
LMSPMHTKADVEVHSEVFRSAVQELVNV